MNQRQIFLFLQLLIQFIFIMQNLELGPSTTSYYSKNYALQHKQGDHNLPPQCRICLQEMINEPQLQYCECKGNLRYVHQQCLIQWAHRTKIHQEGRTRYCFCQICKGRILLQTQTKVSFVSRAEICSSIFCNPILSQRIRRIILVVILFVLLAGLIIQVQIYLSDPEGRGTKVLIALMALNSLFLLVGGLYFLFRYLLSQQVRVVAVKGLAFSQQVLNCMEQKEIF